MSYEAWPSPDAPRGPLPRIEDLPITDQGYDQEAVREAFDAFYRHAAQLDASLKALETVEVFRRDAMELRNDLRSLRALGLGTPEPSWTTSTFAYERPPREIPAAVPRLFAEAALLIGVAVIVGIAHFRTWLIVAAMGIALAIVVLTEWLAERSRFRVPETPYVHGPETEEGPGEPAPYVETPAPAAAVGWSAFEPPARERDALTMVESPGSEEQEEREPLEPPEPVEPPEPEPEPGPEREEEEEIVAAAEPEPELQAEAEPELQAEAEPEPVAVGEAPRRRWFRRVEREQAPVADAAEAAEPSEPSEPPSHVRVLPPVQAEADPWEQGFDAEGAEPEVEPEPADVGGRARRRRR